MESVHDTFKKLRGLSEDDKNENALLRSRIDEQSQLIMFLKQRLDEAAISTKTIEKLNKELENKRDELRVELQLSTSRFNTLDARFNDLARNHEELIKFKDEYKRQNDVLNKENERLRSENKRLFSDALEKSKLRIQELEEQLSGTLERISLVGKEKSLLESKTRYTNFSFISLEVTFKLSCKIHFKYKSYIYKVLHGKCMRVLFLFEEGIGYLRISFLSIRYRDLL